MLQSKISKLSKLLTNLQFFLTVIILLRQVLSVWIQSSQSQETIRKTFRLKMNHTMFSFVVYLFILYDFLFISSHLNGFQLCQKTLTECRWPIKKVFYINSNFTIYCIFTEVKLSILNVGLINKTTLFLCF